MNSITYIPARNNSEKSSDGFLHTTAKPGGDVYPFGMQMPGRIYNSDDYNYGFNGMEKDDEIKGSGNHIDFGARGYDTRLGRWLSVDSEFKMYPQFSPYNFALNVPTNIIDPNGEIATDKDGNVIFTPVGKPEWRWQGKVEYKYDDETGATTFMGIGYYAQKGYIYNDAGKKVEVWLVTDATVYEATQKVTYKQNGIPVYGSVETGKQTVGNATTNCTGDCFIKGKVVLYSNEVNRKFLKQEGYSDVEGVPQSNDIGLYYKGKVVQHAEQYEKDGTVNSKGGVTKKETRKDPQSTWSREYDSYKVIRKGQRNIEVRGAENLGIVDKERGIRIVSKKEFKEVKKQIKTQSK